MKRATIGTSQSYYAQYISIHALVKRATAATMAIGAFAEISIHALVKRATLGTAISYGVRYYFNPRPREEGDRKFIQ